MTVDVRKQRTKKMISSRAGCWAKREERRSFGKRTRSRAKEKEKTYLPDESLLLLLLVRERKVLERSHQRQLYLVLLRILKLSRSSSRTILLPRFHDLAGRAVRRRVSACLEKEEIEKVRKVSYDFGRARERKEGNEPDESKSTSSRLLRSRSLLLLRRCSESVWEQLQEVPTAYATRDRRSLDQGFWLPARL